MAQTKERVRVQAGRGGGPKAELAVAKLHHQEVATTSEPQNMIVLLAQLAKDPKVDPAKMREIFEMQKEIRAEERRIDFDEAFVDLQAELPVINKDCKIEVRAKDSKGDRTGAIQQSTPFASFENMMDVVQPLLTKYRFGLSFSTEPAADGRLNVIGTLSRKGHERKTTFPLPADTTGSKNNAQGWGSSQSYGKRYGMIALLNIRSRAQIDIDTDGHDGQFKRAKAKGGGEVLIEDKQVEVISEEQADKLRELIEWCGVGTAKFNEHFGIKKLAELPANMFETAEKDCEDFHANKQARQRHG